MEREERDVDAILDSFEKRERVEIRDCNRKTRSRRSNDIEESEDEDIHPRAKRAKTSRDDSIGESNDFTPLVDWTHYEDSSETSPVARRMNPPASASPSHQPYDVEAIFDQMRQIITTEGEGFISKNGKRPVTARHVFVSDD